MIVAGIHFPDHSEYVGAAYLVFIALLLIYVAIMAFKMARVERELVELNELVDHKAAAAATADDDAATEAQTTR